MSGRFFLDDMSAKYQDTFKGSTCRLLYHPMTVGGEFPMLVGKVDLPGYVMQNKWTNSEYKSVLNRVIQAINARQQDLSKAAIKKDISYSNMEAIYKEADEVGGMTGYVMKALEFIESESQRPAELLNKIAQFNWGEAFNGIFHTTDEVCKYFTDAVVSMQSGFRISAQITHRINNAGSILYAKQALDGFKDIAFGQLEAGGVGGYANATREDVSVTQGMVDVLMNFWNNKSGNEAADTNRDIIRQQQTNISNQRLNNNEPIAWYKYNAPDRYKPDLRQWRMGQPSKGTFTIEYGKHGRINNLLVETINVTPSKSVIKMPDGTFSSNYYNLDVVLTNAYVHTAHDFKDII